MIETAIAMNFAVMVWLIFNAVFTHRRWRRERDRSWDEWARRADAERIVLWAQSLADETLKQSLGDEYRDETAQMIKTAALRHRQEYGL